MWLIEVTHFESHLSLNFDLVFIPFFLFFSVRVYLNQFVFLFSLDDYVCFQPLIFSQPLEVFTYFYICIRIDLVIFTVALTLNEIDQIRVLYHCH